MLADFRTALRALKRARGFTSITILTLALGIGSATAVFNVVDWVLFRSTDYPPGMAVVGRQFDGGRFVPSQSGVVLEHYETRTGLFAQTSRAAIVIGNVVLDGQPIAIGHIGITEGLLSMFEIEPALGRTFRPEEFTEGNNQVVILTYAFWQNQFGGDPETLGRTIEVEGTPCTVIGILRQHQVMPPQFFMGVLRPHQAISDSTNAWRPPYFFYVRLQAGQTAESVQLALTENPPELSPKLTRQVLNLAPSVRSMNATAEWLRPEYYRVMLGAVAFLYAIACLNATNLIVVRRLGQARELAVRLALGATRWNLIRLSIAESILLVGAGAVAALFVANAMLPLLLSVAGTTHLNTDTGLWRLDGRAITILFGLSALTAIIITLIPLARSLRMRPQTHLKEGVGAMGESRGLARLRGGLVVLQFSAALILLTGAGLMVRTIQNLHAVDPGFEVEDRWKVGLTLPRDTKPNQEVHMQIWRELQTEIDEIPGVIKSGYGSDIIMPGFARTDAQIEGVDGEPFPIAFRTLSEDYIEAAGLRIIHGRSIDPLSPKTEVLINETTAKLRWPDQDPIGQILIPIQKYHLSPEDKNGLQVVGVIRDPVARPRNNATATVYRSTAVSPISTQGFIVHTVANTSRGFGDIVRRKIYAHNPGVVIFNIAEVASLQDSFLSAENLALSVLRFLALIAVVLTIVGIFALLAFSVSLRRGEFGVRLALGANSQHLMGLVFGQGLRLALIGTAAGLGGAWALMSYMESLLYGTSAHDPWVLGTVAVSLISIGLIACVIPAIRATRINIAELLRSE